MKCGKKKVIGRQVYAGAKTPPVIIRETANPRDAFSTIT